VMSIGSTTPVDIAVAGKNLEQSREIADNLCEKLKTLPFLRDVQLGIPLDYPSMKIDIDRERAGLLGLTVEEINQALITATSSSRFVAPVFWLDTKSGNTYQIQVEFPQNEMNSLESMENIPIGQAGSGLLLRDVAHIYPAISYGAYQRYNQQRVVNVTANLEGEDLGTALKAIDRAIADLGVLPKGSSIFQKGQARVLAQTLRELQNGLLVALVAIFLLIVANFQSFRIALAILFTAAAAIAGALLALQITGNTLNIQSFTGAVMALGVSIANCILLVNAAESFRKTDGSVLQSVADGARLRLRPILMTATAMIAGMLPLAAGAGETGQQIAPLGIAVIGGLALSTLATLFVLPSLYCLTMRGASNQSLSLMPERDEE
ncbi:MAG TPA: efflux RND transporter permease subunit, partial [Saprospiraceae bacterium]|nr:efflux RND transporter permease subunit [Saprospiraceae bacterium]